MTDTNPTLTEDDLNLRIDIEQEKEWLKEYYKIQELNGDIDSL
ncbi:MAG TPA: hypothetical protein VM577_14700 [Anaerovoracaceae bacterium]|nr:hypothetical protein [Anaerovoracaceae bacterium]